MMYDETGQDDRPPVYLPENRHHWASNDEVDKPVQDLSRGPVRPRVKSGGNKGSSLSSNEWMKQNLPKIGATMIVVIVILCVMAAIYTDVASIMTR